MPSHTAAFDFYQKTFDALDEPFYVVRVADYSIAFANKAARNLGVAQARTCYELTHRLQSPCEGREHPCPMKHVLESRSAKVVEHVHYKTDGTSYYAEVHGCPLYNEQGEMEYMVEYSVNINDRKKAEETLRQSEERERNQRIFSEALRDMGIALSSTLKLDDVLDRMVENVGKVVPHVSINIMLKEGDALRVVRHLCADDYESVRDNRFVGREIQIGNFPVCRRVIESREPIIIPNTRHEPDWVAMFESHWILSCLSTPILMNNEAVGLLNLNSSTENYFAEEHIRRLQAFTLQASIAFQNAHLYEETQRMALLDPLTNLYNRRGLYEFGLRETNRVQRFKRPLSVLFVDIDHFKRFNDRYGYAVGDLVLKAIADILRIGVRDVDLVSRYGGEEFVTLLPEIGLAEAGSTAERLRKAAAGLSLPGEENISVTVSIGVATLFPEPGNTEEFVKVHRARLSGVIERAGQLLHIAKENGRNRVEVDAPRDLLGE
ncbi:MAG: diguanylate cyclase [Anaerolineales bacterium]|nr:diguanylate cyclase [Anaerolineales bacterium]